MTTASQAIGRSQTSTRQRQNNRELNSYNVTTKLGPFSTTLTFAVIVGVLALLYLTQITKTSVYGYQVNQLDQTQQELQTTQQELTVESARLQSLERIKGEKLVQGLEKVEDPSFARAP